MSPTRTRFGAVGANWPSKRLGAARTAGLESVVRHERARLLGPQAVGIEHATDAPAAHGVALCLHFGPQPAGAVALAMVDKGFAYRH